MVRDETETHVTADVAEKIARVRERVAVAAARAGRDPSSIRIVGVTKTVPADAVEVLDQAYAAGLRVFGENRVQDAARKQASLFANALAAGAELHLIGYLQTNKARDAVRLFSLIHSVDRPGLVDALQRRAAADGKHQDILLQVNVAREPQKHGCAPEEAEALLRHAAAQPNLRVRGLMTIAPLVDDPELTRPVFVALRELRDQLQEATGIALPELSMGMTNDYEVAVEEGATIVRVGRAIFG
ncbi:MAG: YggS family pyridoxal phosphate-dependent enzyme [Sphaerobacter sp.]|nr:YggS family pyridoxal phosphate-dependent enzyme [Sphaerobacter sp.]